MNEAERHFIDSIANKIKKYEISTTTKDALLKSEERFSITTYSDGSEELVDLGIERFLCQKSPLYFISKYAWIPFPGKGEIPFFLYYFQKEILKEMTSLQKLVFLKTRQCLTEDNFVMSDRGYVSIKDVKVGDKVETIVNNEIKFVNVLDSFYNGKKEVCRILTNAGTDIKSTLDHRIFTKRGWVEAKDLTLNDEIASIINKGFFGNFELENDKFAALIGYYLADRKWNQPYFVNTNINYVNEVIEAVKLFENCNPYIYKRKKNRQQAYEARFVSKLNRPIKNFINKFGLNVLSNERCLTKDLLNLNKKQMSILINRLYAGNGWITYKKDNRRKNYIQYEIGLGSPCYKLIKQIEYILQTKYGIHCWIQESPFKGNDFWKLKITQKKSVMKFNNEIGIKDKTDKKEIINLISKEKPYSTNQNFEKIRKIERKEEEQDVYDITTESSSFLTNGLLVHNCGISTLSSLYCLWKANFFSSESIDIVSTTQKKARNFVSKMEPTIKRLPSFLSTPIIAKNQTDVKWANGSLIVSESASVRAGRGDSLSLLILDEAAHYISDNLTRGIIAAASPTLARTGGDLIVISCLTKDTFIFTNNGMQQIEDFIPKECDYGFNDIKDFNIDGLNNQQSCNKFYYSGKTPTIKITTNKGFQIEGTEIHPLMVLENGELKWKLMKDLTKDDLLVFRKGNQAFGNYQKVDFSYEKEVHNGSDLSIKYITEEIAYFLGLYLAEGYIYTDLKKQYKTTIAVTEIEIKNKIEDFSKQIGLHLTKQKTRYTISSKGLFLFLKELGFDHRKRSGDKIIPKKVLQMPRNLTIKFLQGMYDGDGCNNKFSIDYSSKSSKLIRQIQLMLLNFGIMSKIVKNKKTKVFSLLITRDRNIFMKEIGFELTRKNNKISSTGSVYPVVSVIRNIINKYSINKKALQKNGCDVYDRKNEAANKKIGEKQLKIFINENKTIKEVQKLQYLIDKGLDFDFIKTKEFGEAETYDFTIPETHSFIANGFVSSNTPNGTSGSGSYYYEQVNQLLIKGNSKEEKLVEIDWYEVPDMADVKPQKGFNAILNEYVKRDYFGKPEIKAQMKEYFEPIIKEWKGNPWLKKQREDLGDVLFKQEIEHSFIIGSDQVFSEDILERSKNKIQDPITENVLGKTQVNGLWIWKHPFPKHRYILGCLPPGEKVLTNEGLKNIEEVNFDNKLFDSEGRETSILNIQKYESDENIYRFKLEGILRKTSFTGEHPILSSSHVIKRKHGKNRFLDLNFEYNKAEEIRKGDWVVFPNIYRKNSISEKEILNKWTEKSGRKDFDLDKNIILEEDFWWFIGMWLAEGWTQERNYSKSIHTCHNLTEERYANKIRKFFATYKRKVSFRKRDNVIETVFNSSQLYEFLNKKFNRYAKNKTLPEWVKRLPEKLKLNLIQGYLDGDGSIFIDNKNKYNISFVSISQKLLEDFQDILFSVGIISTLQILRRSGTTIFPNGKESSTRETYQLNCTNHFSISLMEKLSISYNKKLKNFRKRKISFNHFSEDLDKIFIRIKNIEVEKYKGSVYNFETDSHNYLCDYLTTHNCDVGKGTSKDFSSVQVMDIENYEQVCEYKAKIGTKMFGRLIRKLARYYNQGYVAIEANGIGEAVFNEVYYHDTDPYDNVYKQKITKNGITVMTGWSTNQKTRGLMTNTLIDWISVDELWEQLKIYSRRLWAELTTWIWKNGRPDHADNSFDDLLIAFGLCIYLRNKASSYGESFLIAEDGSLVEFESKDKDREVSEDVFSIAMTEEDTLEDKLKEEYNCSIEQYKWLTG